jgi:pyruvate dehydrogenase E1 component
VNTIPFFIYYSMFGFQRIGDLIWAAADMRCKGFLVGGTAGRTTLAGEGLQHQDGHSHHLMQVVPTLRAYDPAYAFEIAVIVRDGLRRMYVEREDTFRYFTVCNENYPQPAMPKDVGEDEILHGMYRLRRSEASANKVQLLASGAITNEAVRAADLLAERFGVAADVWSVTSWTELRRDALAIERENLRRPGEQVKVPYFTQRLADAAGPIVAASDYVKALPDGVARWSPRRMVSLGTDGFGRSEDRPSLRAFFEVDAANIAFAALRELQRAGSIGDDVVRRAQQDLGIDPAKPDPSTV